MLHAMNKINIDCRPTLLFTQLKDRVKGTVNLVMCCLSVNTYHTDCDKGSVYPCPWFALSTV